MIAASRPRGQRAPRSPTSPLRTPTLPCGDLGELARTPVALKAECLQVTGSFKLRGVLAKVADARP